MKTKDGNKGSSIMHNAETIFPITQKYLEKCEKNGWERNCAFCALPFVPGHVCHSKFNGIRYKKRHAACALQLGFMNRTDFKFAVAGYSDKNPLPITPIQR